MARFARSTTGLFAALVGGHGWLLVGLAAVLGMPVVAGCSGKTEPGRPAAAAANAPATQSRGTIGVSLLTLDNPFFKVIGDAIVASGSAQGYQTLVVSAEKDVARQGNQVKDFIVRKVSAIVLSPCDSKAIGPVIAEANAAGIPVFTVDIPYRGTDAKVVTQVATDNFGGGEEAARAMIEANDPHADGRNTDLLIRAFRCCRSWTR